MSDMVRSVPGTPFITKVAKTLDQEITDTRAAINYVGRVYRAQKENVIQGKNVNEQSTIGEPPVVTAEQIRKEMDREMID